jgi:hypothetical protein
VIHEYALEPELVASWHEQMRFRFFVEQFGFGTGRVASRYPKNWRQLVLDAFETTFGGTVGELGRKRFEELLVRLTVPEIIRASLIWNHTLGWLQNAEYENARRPFDAILARENPRSHPNVICEADVLAGTPLGWAAPRSAVVPRTAVEMAKCVQAMLRCARWVVFVDPHFRAFRPESLNPLGECLKIIAAASSTTGVEIHAAGGDWAAPWDKFKSDCERYLPRVIPAGFTLIVRRWVNRTGGEALHNRYILTDVGAVAFATGLDEGATGTTDDVTLLEAEMYSRRLNDYTSSNPAFELEDEVMISARS